MRLTLCNHGLYWYESICLSLHYQMFGVHQWWQWKGSNQLPKCFPCAKLDLRSLASMLITNVQYPWIILLGMFFLHIWANMIVKTSCDWLWRLTMSILASHVQFGWYGESGTHRPNLIIRQECSWTCIQKKYNFIFIFIYFIIFLYIGIRIHIRKHIDYIDYVFVLVQE